MPRKSQLLNLFGLLTLFCSKGERKVRPCAVAKAGKRANTRFAPTPFRALDQRANTNLSADLSGEAESEAGSPAESSIRLGAKAEGSPLLEFLVVFLEFLLHQLHISREPIVQAFQLSRFVPRNGIVS